jgi:hypothetical protein
MKTVITIILSVQVWILAAQEFPSNKRVDPRFWFTTTDTHKKISARLYEVQDTLILYSFTSTLDDYKNNNFTTQSLVFTHIESIWYWNHNNFLYGMLAGGLAGAIVGSIIGRSEKSDEQGMFSRTASQKATNDLLESAIIGAGIGAVIGNIKVHIPIKGSLFNYNNNKQLLTEKSVKYKYLGKHE